MALTLQDFVHGIDFTGINPATGGDHNNLVDLAAPVQEDAAEGKGLCIWTSDTALNVPNVPQATLIGAAKWQKYLWIRVPFAGAIDKTPKLYVWNPDAVLDVTFLAWIQVVSDTSGLQTQITALANQLGAIQSTAVNAQTVANQANATANQANTNSQNALNQIAGAVTTANAAKTASDAATAAVTVLTSDLNTLQQQVGTIANTNIPTLTNLVRSCCILAEAAASQTDLGALVAGQNTRNINTKVYDSQNLVTLSAGKITFNVAGTYKIRAKVPWYISVQSGDLQTVQPFIKKDSDNSILAVGDAGYITITGTSGFHVNRNQYTEVVGVVTVALNEIIRIDLHARASGGLLGKAAQDGSANFPATDEIYTTVEIQQLF